MVRKLAFLLAVLASQLAAAQVTPPSYSGPGGSSISFPITAPQGGSGVVSPTANCVLIGEGSAAYHVVCPAVAGYVLVDNGPGVDPSFQPAPAPPTIDVNAVNFTITPITGVATAYLDCNPQGTGIGHCNNGITIADGIVDGQILNIVCSSYGAVASGGGAAWNIGGDFNTFTTLSLGGSNLGSYDLASTDVDPNLSSCGATLMWSDANGVWELGQIYGGTVS